MIRCPVAVCADRIIRDAESNNISVIHVIDRMRTPTLPNVFPRLSFYFHLVRNPEEDPNEIAGNLRLAVDDELLGEYEMDVDFEGQTTHRVTGVLKGLPIPQPGTLSAALFIGEEEEDVDEVGRWEIRVEQTGGARIENVEQDQAEGTVEMEDPAEEDAG